MKRMFPAVGKGNRGVHWRNSLCQQHSFESFDCLNHATGASACLTKVNCDLDQTDDWQSVKRCNLRKQFNPCQSYYDYNKLKSVNNFCKHICGVITKRRLFQGLRTRTQMVEAAQQKTSQNEGCIDPGHIRRDETREVHVLDKVELTEQEKKVFQTLLEVVKEHPERNTTLRAAGGWVRDKLLGHESDDVDIALDDCFGEDFAKLIDDKIFKSQDPNGQKKQHFGVIKSNCEKSKHLETATIKVHGQMIDLVNLRSEEYSNDSRIPTMEIGTPLQDALRRDLTINSMFYNINEDKIEDWTGKGMSDLKAGIIRTPLEPLQTFLDDPLRILRTIRFKNRFEFDMAEEIYTAVADPKVRVAFRDKVTFERCGKELDKCFEGNKPEVSMRDLHDFHILSLLYKIPQDCAEQNQLDEAKVEGLIDIATNLGQVVGYLFEQMKIESKTSGCATLYGRTVANSWKELCSFQQHVIYTVLLFPFYSYKLNTNGKKKAYANVVQYILCESLKRSNSQTKFVLDTCQFYETYLELLTKFQENKAVYAQSNEERLKLGWFLKEAGGRWLSVNMLATANMYVKQENHLTSLITRDHIHSDKLRQIIDIQTEFNVEITRLQLNDFQNVKQLLDGKTVCELYGIKPGKILKFLLDELISFQIIHPNATKEDAMTYMAGNKDQFLSKYE